MADDLFPPYPATIGEVDGAGTALESAATKMTTVSTDVCAAGKPVVANVDGQLAAPATMPTDAAAGGFGEVSGASMYAAGVMTLWSRAIKEYNTGVGKLNDRWRDAKADDFGVEAADYSDADTQADRDAVDSDRAADVSAARSTLLQELKQDEQDLMDVLDTEAGSVSGKLSDGPTEDNVLALFLAGALPATAFTVFDVELTQEQLRTMKEALQRNGLLETYFDVQPGCGMSSKDLKKILDQARAMDVDPKDYKDLLQQYYVTKAAEKAGIDMCDWDPSKGAEGLREIIEKVYTYYGDLYLDNPDLKWAGMANMIGPSFAGGFFDLNMFRDIADGLSGPLDDLPDEVRDNLPFPLNEIGKLSDLTQEDIAYYEETFLQMQKDIFIDQAAMHEAYLEGGTDAIEEMRDAGLFDNGDPDQTMESWEQIDEGIRTGDSDLVDQGNTGLLYREQHDIIDETYQEMYDHDPTGPLVTYMMGVVGDPSIPGAQSLGEVDPLEFKVDVDAPFGIDIAEVDVKTPFPEGNIADFDTRWGLIEDDTLPAYMDLLENDPDGARDIIESDVHDRIEENRLIERAPEILHRLETDWDIDWDWF